MPRLNLPKNHLLAIALSIGLAVGCAGDKKADEAASIFKEPVSIADKVGKGRPAPAMWRVSDTDTTIFLFGAFHLLPPDLTWRTKAYDEAMARSATTITEADTTSAAAIDTIRTAVQTHGLNPADVTLSETVGKKRAKRIRALAEQYNVPMAALEPMRPWLATLTLTQRAFQTAGFDASAGVEAAVLSQAAAEGDAIAHLETAAFQIEALASLDGADMIGNFDASIDQLKEFEDMTKQMLTAWRAGDEKRLEENILEPLREASPTAFDILFDQRNANWVGQIDKLMNGEGDYFITVGAGHLVGDNSVVAQLKDRGFRVERVQ